MPRSRRNQTRLCYGYIPGATPLVTRPATTPDCEPHEPWPEGHIASSAAGQSWLVPRIWIAVHGLKAADLPALAGR